MRHAGPAALDRLAPLLGIVRGHAGLTERSRGVFYRHGKAFLHFHEDAAGLFADLRDSAADFSRHPVESAADCAAFAARLASCMAQPAAAPKARAAAQ